MLLAYKPVIYDLENHRVSPLGLPDYNWMLSQVQHFTCRYGHEQIEPTCGCGIQSTLNLHEMARLGQEAASPMFPVGILLVQVLGNARLDERTWNIRSERVYFYGAVLPLWSDPEVWADWWEVLKGRYARIKWKSTPKPALFHTLWAAEGQIVNTILKTADAPANSILRRYLQYAHSATTDLA